MIRDQADREVLCRWVDEGATVREIARRLGCARSWAGELLRQSGVSRRRVVVPAETRRRRRLSEGRGVSFCGTWRVEKRGIVLCVLRCA